MEKSDQPERFDHKAFLARTPTRPGVYDMRDEEGKTLYIGKAKNLKNRLSSYFRATGLTTKTMALVNRIDSIHTTITHSEMEALLLEQNLIKDKKPQYNILLKDDKSYPYIYLSTDDDFPLIDYHRGRSKSKKGTYYGPYPSGAAVRDSLHLLQKIFKLRQCEDSYFRNRSRPCLQHQINRCKAPCVLKVSKEEYAQDVQDTRSFLEGKSPQLIRSLIKRMEKESVDLNFEQAAELRDQINQLRHIQEQQSVDSAAGDADIIGFAEMAGKVSFDVLFVRGGRLLGHKSYFPNFRLEAEQGSYLSEFMAQFYIKLAASRNFPAEIILPFPVEDLELLEQGVSNFAQRSVRLKHRVRGERLEWQKLAEKNASISLQTELANKTHIHKRIIQLSDLLGMKETISRMECFDISHTMGEATVASCVVFDKEGPLKSEYRRFNITGITGGDDYGAMRKALFKRYEKLAENPDKTPSVILIDGGKGQLSMAEQVMEELSLQHIPLLGVAKGVTRKAGLETLLFEGRELSPEGYDAALLLIQHIRDESHRFAITGHRQRRQVARKRSALEDIPGVGAKRRSALLKFFGGRQGVLDAPVNELAKVEGISQTLADQIYEHLHPR
ncbi:excinuclease ABC subunit C [Endozoicomonas sp. OPT23]|nr:excinuclease ABC subunit UvrC [Endozoicomonas sp. OPT23]MRI34263.1 excinuclease ABC subunit C [Endozoicomonas sp. OPT23]